MPTSEPRFPVLVLDIGNTSTVLGLAEGPGTFLHTWRVKTNREAFPDDLAALLHGLFQVGGFAIPKAAVVSSVVPPVGENYVQALQKYFGIQAFVVSAPNLPDVTLELDGGTLGADRLCNLFGAEKYLGAHEYAIVVDFGTCTNFDVIGRGRRFLGGILATGAQVSADALFNRTAQLPRVPLQAPAQALGKNTVQALQSGLVLGYAEMIDGLLRRLKRELPRPAVTIATGGFARTVQSICQEIEHYDDALTTLGALELWSTR